MRRAALVAIAASLAAGCGGDDDRPSPEVERDGPIALLWVRGRESGVGERARDCLL